jgi:hypothetical protein
MSRLKGWIPAILILVLLPLAPIPTIEGIEKRVETTDLRYSATVVYGVDTAWVEANVAYDNVPHGYFLQMVVLHDVVPNPYPVKGSANATIPTSEYSECGMGEYSTTNHLTYAQCWVELWQELHPYLSGTANATFRLELGLGTWPLLFRASLHLGRGVVPAVATAPVEADDKEFSISILPAVTTTVELSTTTTERETVTTIFLPTTTQSTEAPSTTTANPSTVASTATIPASENPTSIMPSSPVMPPSTLILMVLLVVFLAATAVLGMRGQRPEKPKRRVFCMSCGSKIPDEADFCPECGQKRTL